MLASLLYAVKLKLSFLGRPVLQLDSPFTCSKLAADKIIRIPNFPDVLNFPEFLESPKHQFQADQNLKG